MTEAQRLLEAGSEHERALLRAGAEEVPTDESVRAAARVLGFVPPAAVLASVAAVIVRAVKGSVFNGYVLAPALLAGALTAAYAVAMHPSANVAPHAGAVVQPQPEETPLRAPAPIIPAASVLPAPDSIAPSSINGIKGERMAVPRSLPVPAVRAVGREASVDPLQEQVALVDRARTLVASGDPNGALHAVDAYDRRFPRGVLSEEASLLRIQAVAARGDRGAAASLAQRFRVEYPRSVHTDKIRWLLGDDSK